MPQEPLTAEEQACLLDGLPAGLPAAGQDAAAGPYGGLPKGVPRDTNAGVSPTDSPGDASVLGCWEQFGRRFASRLAESLAAKLRIPVDSQLAGSEQATSARFLLGGAPCRCLIRCQAPDSPRPLWLEIDPPVVFACLERMLGGSPSVASPPLRPLTELEQRLTGKLAEHCLAVLRDCWPGPACPAFTVTGVEVSPLQVPQEPRALLAVAEFRVALGVAAGRIALALPWTMLASAACASGAGAAGGSSASGGTATVTVVLARLAAEPGQLSDLEVGDLIATDQRPSDPLEVTVDGQPRYRGAPGAVDGHKAVRIE